MEIRLKNEKDLNFLRVSGKILADTLKGLKNATRAGVKLNELDDLARALIHEAGGKPAFLGYRPEGARKAYPAAICASLNETVVHGLPNDYALKPGDILKIDLGVNYKSYITDAAVTIGIGEISENVRKLIAVTEKALEIAIKECKAGNHLSDYLW